MLSFLLFSCLHSPIQPKSYVDRYHVQIEARFQNLEDKNIYDQVTLDLDLQLSPNIRFKDDSVSYRLMVSDGKATKNGESLPFTLTGKWVEIRAFEFGELLSIMHMDEWVEENVYIDSFDILWFVLYPNPPNIEKGEKRTSLSRYPLQYAESQKSRAVLQNTWELIEVGSQVQLEYEGNIDIRGTWQDLRLSSKGKQEGTVVIQKSGGTPTAHTGKMKRTLCYTKAKTVCQKQEFQYKMEQRR